MKNSKRFLSFLLSLALLLTLLPLHLFPVAYAEDDAFTLDNGYIQVSVSKRNGGFRVGTVQGDLLRKSDNNKDLLYHSGSYDTSFVSFRVGTGAEAKDYLFGGTYAGAGAISVTQEAEGGEIVARWTVDGITFIQSVTLAAENASEHGMVSVGLSAQNNSGKAVPIQARILYDTCLGDQDYAYYQVTGGSLTETLQREQIITDEASLKSFYALDDLANPLIAAYVVSEPVKAAVGHWNNLAASLFDFAPDASLNFTNAINDYLTADSACALYYDLGTVADGASATAASYYGVYSNHTVDLSNRVAVNTVAPLRLELNDDKSAYVRQSSVGVADFAVKVSAENYRSETSQDLDNVILAVRSTSGIRSLSDSGQIVSNYDYETADPFTIAYAKMENGEIITKDLYFKAKSPVNATYERITIGMYKNSVTTENLLGEKTVYLLLPGNDGNIPKVSFVSMTPGTIYSSGTRHLYVAITNEVILENALDQGICVFKAYSADGKTVVDIPSDAITINDGVADIALGNEISLALGSWYLQLEWSDDAVANGIVSADFQKQTAAVLKFTVSDDVKFKNDTYGVIAAVKYETGTGSSHTFYYRLESFQDETAFAAWKELDIPERKDVLLVFRGAFTGDNRYPVKDAYGKTVGYRYYTAVSKKSVDASTRETTVDNLITINNCVDFEGGTMSVYYEDYANQSQDRAIESAVLCEFDGDLYTSDARTSIWTGKAALTKLEQGKEFGLITYDSNGNRKSENGTPITLIWPSVFSYAQTLAGCAFKLAYGQFGAMKGGDGNDIGRTISFSASLSLSFMTSPKQDPAETPDTYFGRMQDLWKNWRGASIYQYAYSGDHLSRLLDIDMNDDTDEHEAAKKGVKASVMVKDILFGCGEGFVGLNFTVDFAVQNMIESLPKLTGKLSINTINNWSFGVQGSCKFTDNMKLEAKLSFKSYENIPIPDEYYFFMGGFKPGVNIDGGGVVWIRGAGGGMSNIYDTVFCSSGLPPLKLTMVAAFSIMQVLDGTAKLELSLSGLNLTASDLKIMDEIEVIQKIQLGLQWYPDLKLNAGIYVSMFEKVIEGQGYMILIGKNYTDWFFEAFIRAQLKVPESVPGVGGMTILGADLGISTEKIWGAFEAIKIKVGLSYYWGEDDVSFGTGDEVAQPTYPNLLLEGFDGKHNDFPIAHDDVNHRTLYAHFGTNFEAPRGAQVLSEKDLILMGTAGVWSTSDKTSHKFNLGAYDADNNMATMVQLNYAAGSLAEAKTLAQSFTVKDSGGASFPLEFYNGSNLDTANANVSWNGDAGIATLAFTVTEQSQFDKDWLLKTGTTAADVVLYNVLPLPELTEVSAAGALVAGGQAEINWSGSRLDELDNVNFYLVSSFDPNEDAGYPLTLEIDPYAWPPTSIDIPSGSATLDIPAGIPAGEYYVRAVYSKDDQLNALLHSAGTYTVTNPNTPAAMGTPSISPCGDLKYGVTVPATTDANTTGYLVSVLNEDGTATEITDLIYDKAETGATSFRIGGSYEAPIRADEADPDSAIIGTEVHGLEGGKRYMLEITPYKTLDSDGDGEDDAIVYGDPYRSGAIALPQAVTPTATLRARGMTLTAVQDMTDSTVLPTFTESALNVEASFSEAVSGTWTLDDSELWVRAANDTAVVSGSFTDLTAGVFTIPALTDGDHTLTVTGRAADGDAFSSCYHFTVDTTAPRLLLSSPLNGSPFNADGTLTVSGVTDHDAELWISIDGGLETKLPVTPNADGVFSETTPIPNYNDTAVHSLRLYAVDPNGNRTETREITVSHPGLGDLQDIVLMVDGAIPSSGSLSTADDAENLPLTVMGVTSAGVRFALDPARVGWHSYAAEGAITVDGDGRLSWSAYAKGFVEAMIEVSGGAYRTASLALSTETPSSMVDVSVTVGGRVTGGGSYDEGEAVALLATPEDGYRFDHWEITGVTGVGDPDSLTLRFTMPGSAVTIKAYFVPIVLHGDLNGDGEVNALDLVRLRKYLLGENVILCVSGDLNGNGLVNALDLIRLKKYLLNEPAELH